MLAPIYSEGKFVEFWEECNTNSASTLAFTGFKEAMRSIIAENIKITCRSLSSELFQAMVGLSSAELSPFCSSSPAVEELKGDLVVMTPCLENQPREKYFEESLRFDEALRLCSSIRRVV